MPAFTKSPGIRLKPAAACVNEWIGWFWQRLRQWNLATFKVELRLREARGRERLPCNGEGRGMVRAVWCYGPPHESFEIPQHASYTL